MCVYLWTKQPLTHQKWPKRCFAPQQRALFRHRRQSNRPKVARTCGNFNILTQNVFRATTACTFSTSQLPKVARTCGNFNILTENVLRNTTACACWTSQLPKGVRTWGILRCFVHFHFQMCYARQQRALFRHLNFQKSSETQSLIQIWLCQLRR